MSDLPHKHKAYRQDWTQVSCRTGGLTSSCVCHAESAEFATSREEIEADYRKKLREYKRRHSTKKATGNSSTAAAAAAAAAGAADVEQVKDADSVAKIQRQPSDATSLKEADIEGQVGALCAHTPTGIGRAAVQRGGLSWQLGKRAWMWVMHRRLVG